jgi:hypothetical protein
MRAGLRNSLAKPVTLALTGPGGGSWILDPGDKLITVTGRRSRSTAFNT